MTCRALQQGDEMYCDRCDLRWSLDEDPPGCRTGGRYVIGLTGAAGSGKSTAAEHLVHRHGFVHLKFAGPLKAMFRALLTEMGVHGTDQNEMVEGWLKESHSAHLNGHTPRHAMQTLGTEWGRQCMGEDFWVNVTRSRIMNLPPDTNIVIDDVRFENEAELIRSFGGKIIQITGRGGIAGQHPSEAGVQWDMRYTNEGTIPELTGWLDYVLPLAQAR